MNLDEELEKTVALIIRTQQERLLKLIKKQEKWDSDTMDSSSSTKKSTSNQSKRGRGRPRKDTTNLAVIYRSQKEENGEKKVPYSNGRILE